MFGIKHPLVKFMMITLLLHLPLSDKEYFGIELESLVKKGQKRKQKHKKKNIS